MRFEGQFKDGCIRGHGLVTFPDGTNGIPRNEGLFEQDKMVTRGKCDQVIQDANMAAQIAQKLLASKIISK